jgi:hypothetical protein
VAWTQLAPSRTTVQDLSTLGAFRALIPTRMGFVQVRARRHLLLGAMLAALSCDGSTTTCPTDLCAGRCCPSGEVCAHGPDGGDMGCVQTCTISSGCASGCCAPLIDAVGNPVGPYVCHPADGSAYGCCSGVTCTALICCVQDSRDNTFCALPCDGDSDCGSFTHCHFDYPLFSQCLSARTGSCGP